MQIKTASDPLKRSLFVSGKMGRIDVGNLHRALCDLFAVPSDLVLGLDNVSGCDTAALQIIYCAARSAAKAGRNLQIRGLGVADSITSLCTSLGLTLDTLVKPEDLLAEKGVDQEVIETYMLETEDLLVSIESNGLTLATGGGTPELVHQLFRAFHTIKGSSSMCGLDQVAEFTHHAENLLAAVRDGAIEVTPQLGRIVLKAKDHIKDLVQAESTGKPAPVKAGRALLAEIRRMLGEQTETPRVVVDPNAPERTWRISFRPDAKMLAGGADPASLFNDLWQLGDCDICGSLDAIPDLDAIEPQDCYLRWEIRLRTGADENAIRDVFVFVENGAELKMECEAVGEAPAARKPAESAPASAATPPSSGVAAPGPVAVEKPSGQKQAAAPTVATPAAAQARRKDPREAFVRVPSERLDRLVNLVGEFVMNQCRLAQAAAGNASPELAGPVQELERLVGELRENVLGIRMLPIGTLFDRFRRLVHDLSEELGKETVLVTEGADTELDKSILDQLGEPLVHCLRNSVDHGVETPEVREANGKKRGATVRLSAVHTGSNVVVQIQDDGRGIDREKVRAKAVERGLISADAALSDREVFNLIMIPGFSTASQITNVSGRGVGMDAVKRQIEALRGNVSIASEVGKGTSISITLPLTLAIIEGLLVQIGSESFIVPMSAVQENVELTSAERKGKNGRNVIVVRGGLVPYIDLRAAFRIPGEPPPIEKVVIVQHDGDRVGLVVDRVLGTHQTVIQSLGRFFRGIEVMSGATIMGDGSVSLIMDIAAVVRYMRQDGQVAAA